MQIVFAVYNDSGELLMFFDSQEKAIQSWKLSYSKLFVPTFVQTGKSVAVFSPADSLLGSIKELVVYHTAEHL